VRLLSRSRRARSPVAAGQRAAAHARPGGRAQHRPLAIAMATLVPCRAGRRTSVAGVLPRAPGKGRRPAQARAVNSPTQLAHPFFLVRCRPAHVGLLWKPVGERASVRGSFTQGSPSAEAPQEVTAAAPQLATASFQSPPQGQAYSMSGFDNAQDHLAKTPPRRRLPREIRRPWLGPGISVRRFLRSRNPKRCLRWRPQRARRGRKSRSRTGSLQTSR